MDYSHSPYLALFIVIMGVVLAVLLVAGAMLFFRQSPYAKDSDGDAPRSDDPSPPVP